MRKCAFSLLLSGWILAIQVPATAEILLDRAGDGSLVLHNRGDSGRAPATRKGGRTGAPSPELATMIERQARKNRLDPDLVTAVVAVESAYRPTAVSHKGAVGLMQLMPATSRALEVSDPLDPEQNLAGGSEYLRQMLDRFGGDLRLALAGYNAGPEAVRRFGGVPPYAETRSYIERVLSLYGGSGRVGRPVFLQRDDRGRLTLTTSPAAGR